MPDWPSLIADDFAVPDDLSGTVDQLVFLLSAADPEVRDDQAWLILTTWLRRGVLDDRLTAVGDALVAGLGHPEIQARSFAALVLAAVVDRDTAADLLDDATLRRWCRSFATWWPAEPDTRGWDERLGWLHVVAHGADLAGAFGTSRRLDGAALLTVLARRVVAATGQRWTDLEEDRVARAVVRILERPELTPAGATGWLSAVDALFATGRPGPVPAPAGNTLAVLRATYVLADRRAVPHRTAVTEAIAQRLHTVFPAYPERRVTG